MNNQRFDKDRWVFISGIDQQVRKRRSNVGRRLLLILSIWLLFGGLVCLSQAQVPLTGAGKGAPGGGNDPATMAWIGAVVGAGGTVSATQTTRINTLIVCLKAGSDFARFDRLWIYGGESVAQQANIDLVNLGVSLPVNSPTLSASGYTGNGVNSHINTQFTPSTQAVNWTLNVFGNITYVINASTTFNTVNWGTWITNRSDMSGYFLTGPRANVNGNGVFVDGISSNSQGSWGFIGGGTLGANTLDVYLNGAPNASNIGLTFLGLDNGEMWILDFNQGGGPVSPSANTIAAVGFGGWDVAASVRIAACINTYMTAWGINVY